MAAKKFNVIPDPRAGLLPDPRVAARYDVTPRTIDNWDRQPALNFPKPIRINRRKYRRLNELENWERERAAS
jgi:hypothetical protein